MLVLFLNSDNGLIELNFTQMELEEFSTTSTSVFPLLCFYQHLPFPLLPPLFRQFQYFNHHSHQISLTIFMRLPKFLIRRCHLALNHFQQSQDTKSSLFTSPSKLENRSIVMGNGFIEIVPQSTCFQHAGFSQRPSEIKEVCQCEGR